MEAAGVKKARLDVLLVERGLAPSRSQAQRLVMAGQVRLNGEVAHKPSQQVDPSAELQLLSGPRFVSRGGDKLEAALQSFGIQVTGATCADVGASTGGFTDCLLQHGAARVYAIDVGRGQLHWSLRQDPRVVVLERTNARGLERLPESVSLASVDVSFISLGLILPRVAGWLAPPGDVIALVKPQFEAGRGQVGKGGVVRSPEIHAQVLREVILAAAGTTLGARGLLVSPLLGPKGNREFLLWLRLGETGRPIEDLLAAVPPGPASLG
jgi:23S rRNA (cytidine1920-2'-O)/16S rRNA (cytidine1409-2'-O)-methyltransferase